MIRPKSKMNLKSGLMIVKSMNRNAKSKRMEFVHIVIAGTEDGVRMVLSRVSRRILIVKNTRKDFAKSVKMVNHWTVIKIVCQRIKERI